MPNLLLNQSLWIILGVFLLFLTAASFSLASSTAMHFFSSSNNSSSVSYPRTASRSSSKSFSSTPKLKLFAISITALLIFADSSSLAKSLQSCRGSSVYASRCHSYTPWWHHPNQKQGCWHCHRCCNPSRIASVPSQCLPQLQNLPGRMSSSCSKS